MLRSRIDLFIENDSHLMHSNFLVTERVVAFTSANLTTTGMDSNYESLLVIEDHEVAHEFRMEFERICRVSSADHLLSLLQREIDGVSLNVLFAPSDEPELEIIEGIEQATSSIQIAVFTFSKSSNRIIKALVMTASRGVDIKIVLDSDQARQPWAPIKELLQAGIHVRHIGGDGMRMHHKLISIDGQSIFIGTYNFSSAARLAHETLITIKATNRDSNNLNQELAKYVGLEISRLYENGSTIT